MKPNRDPSPHHYYISERLEARSDVKLLLGFNTISKEMVIKLTPIEIRGKSLQDCVDVMEKYIRKNLKLEDLRVYGDTIVGIAHMNTFTMEVGNDIFRPASTVATRAVYRLHPIYKS